MNLYIVTNNDPNKPGYDYYDSILVAAMGGLEAVTIRPENPMTYDESHWPLNIVHLSVEKIGICTPNRPAGFIMGSFNQS